MIYGIVWLLSDVSLVQLHYLGASLVIKGLLASLIVAGSMLWQGFVRQRDWRFELVIVSGVVLLAMWRVNSLPDNTVPAPEPGYWVGQWVGLPGQSSAMFQPYARASSESTNTASAYSCNGEPLPFHFWVRGLRASHLKSDAVRPGTCVGIQLVLEPEGEEPPPAIESWRQRNRILATLRVAKGSDITLISPAVTSVDQWRLDIRHRFESAADLEADHRWSYLGKLPVLLGLVTGDRALMRPAHWKVFSDTGTSHLMSISGSHVGMFAVFVYTIVNWLIRRFTRLTVYWPAQHPALIAGWFGALGYALLAGVNVPTQRTLVMIGVAVFLKLQGRSILDWRAWWLALVAVTLYDPLAIFDRGAWLSFFAVAIILWVLQGRLRSPTPIKGWLLVQWGIFVGLSPLLIYAFGGFPWISAVANAVAIPVTGFVVVPGAMIASLLLWLDPPGAGVVMSMILATTDALLWFLQQMADLGGAGYRVPQPGPSLRPVVLTLMALLGVLWWLAPRGTPGKWLAMALALPICSGPGFFTPPSPQLTWLSGAARQSVLIETSESVWWVFEAGQPSRKRQPMLEAWLNQKGYGYRWDTQSERYADWIRNGFLVERYDKFAPLPGQIHLRPPMLIAPCQSAGKIRLAAGLQLTPRRTTENACWLDLHAADTSILMAGNLTRDTQIAQASGDETLSVDTLLLTPRSGQKLLGAVLNRYTPDNVVEWPGKSSVLAEAKPKLDARGIKVTAFPDFARQTRFH